MTRQATEAGILQALEDIILEQGVKGVGINAVGKRAGVSTELIYRYFDGMPGLMMAWMQRQDFWTRTPMDLAGAGVQTPAQEIMAMLQGQVRMLRDNPALAEIRRWELVQATETGQALAHRREKTARVFVDRIDQALPQADIPAQLAVMLAGVLYLSLRSKTEDRFLGLALNDAKDWDRIWAALSYQIAALPGIDPGAEPAAARQEAMRDGAAEPVMVAAARKSGNGQSVQPGEDQR